MEHNENIIKEDSFSQICRNIYAGVISVAILAILVVFPLYYRDHYFDILESKYQFYYMTMISMFAVVLLLSLAFLIVDALEFKAEHAKACIKKMFISLSKGCADSRGRMFNYFSCRGNNFHLPVRLCL